MEIKYYNRQKNQIEVEKVYGDGLIKWAYSTSVGKSILSVLTKSFVSKLYGSVQSLSISRNKIPDFIHNFDINMNEFIPEENIDDKIGYSNFNNFFIRRFKSGLRSFGCSSDLMGAFAEARYYGYEKVLDDEAIPVKGKFLTPRAIISNDIWNDVFSDGSLLLARLCPVDYHRFHFPVDGEVIDSYRVKGRLHSVNPVALKEMGDILSTNERHVTIINSKEFGKIAYVEVGALAVGKIVQSYKGTSFEKGQEKGYFLFGGSTVIVIGEKGKWLPSRDIIENTKKGIETYIQLGDEVAKASI